MQMARKRAMVKMVKMAKWQKIKKGPGKRRMNILYSIILHFLEMFLRKLISSVSEEGGMKIMKNDSSKERLFIKSTEKMCFFSVSCP